MARDRELSSFQSASVMGVPATVNQPSSLASAPVRKRRRRNTGCRARRAISRRVKASRSVSALDQSYQEISLSWQ
jgi:hypothetical protein